MLFIQVVTVQAESTYVSGLDLHLERIIKFTLFDYTKKCMLTTLGLMDEMEK